MQTTEKQNGTAKTGKSAGAAGSGNVRTVVMVGMLAAVSFVLMFFDFSIPIMPSFIKMDISDLPALLGSFALGPVAGAATCLVKNLLHLLRTSTGGVGELSNFILGCALVVPAGLIYSKFKTRRGGISGGVAGAVVMGAVSVVTNYFLVYPVYFNFMPEEAIIAAYQAINPNVSDLFSALLWFNMPFTFVKGMLCVALSAVLYKPLSPIIKGTRSRMLSNR